MNKIIIGLVLLMNFGVSQSATMIDAAVVVYDDIGQVVLFDGNSPLISGSIGGGVWDITSIPPFLGSPSNFHDGTTFGPGSYSIDTVEGSVYNFTVADGQIGGHILWDWGVTTDMDIINVWDINNIAGLATYTSTDIDANGILGIGLIDGPFAKVPFSVNFNFSTVVPIPPAVWLFTSGLLGLIGLARKKHK